MKEGWTNMAHITLMYMVEIQKLCGHIAFWNNWSLIWKNFVVATSTFYERDSVDNCYFYLVSFMLLSLSYVCNLLKFVAMRCTFQPTC